MPKLVKMTSKIGSGATPRGGKNAYKGGGYALIRSQNILDFNFSFEGLVKINDEQAEALSNAEVVENDVLLNITGDSVARCCQVDSRSLPACVNQHVCIIRPIESKLDSSFLKYFLLTPKQKQYLLTIASAGATRNALTKGMIEELEIPNLPIYQQKTIASVLGVLDDKIEKNRRMNETLEEMARAIFKSWFVDFDPVHAKAAGSTPAHMDAATAALFPSSFDDDGLPVGWRHGQISELCKKIENGGTPKRGTAEYWEPKEVNWLTSGEVRASIVLNTENFISVAGFKNSSAKLWPPKTTVVALYGATAGQVTYLVLETTANQACCGLQAVDECSQYIFYALATSTERLALGARGSAQQNLSKGLVSEFKVKIPPLKILRAFDRAASPLTEKSVANLAENQTLSELRDTLLPKLISGEIRVADAERKMETVI